jgi:thiamine kinase-like enzyme
MGEQAHLTPEDIIARIADWKGHEVRTEELGGGITNHNYIVWVDGGPEKGGKKYVMRVPGIGTDMFIDRDVERYCMIQAAKAGVGPAVAYQIDPEGALVIDFVEGEVMHPDTIAGHPDRLRQVVRTVKTVHDKAVFKNEIPVFDMIRNYTKIARDVNAPMPDDLQAMLKVVDDIEEAMMRDPVPYVACHNDLLSENFIIDGDGHMWVIDWEYGGMTDPYFDLGDFVMEHPFTRDEERLIISTYCGEMNERFFGRMMLYKIVTGVWWAVWAMIQHTVSHIDFDYMEWGLERGVTRGRLGVNDPDYQQWLAAQ